jgi:TonB family protein
VFLTQLPGQQSQKAAIKLIPADAPDAESHIACWALTKALSHPHLTRLFYTGSCQIETTPLLYTVTEYADEVLSQILPERSLTPVEAREMLDAALDALSFLHGKGLVHGHLKPSNILAVDDQLKLSSDSLHVAGEPGNRLPAPSVYQAPEGATEAVSPATDVWSLGVTLVEALTQHPPVWDRSAGGEPVVPESVPQPFAGIARECLRSDPGRRCTLSDVRARLEPAPSLASPASKAGKALFAKRRTPALAAAALVVFAAIAVLLLRFHQTRPSPPTVQQQSAPAMAAPQPQSPAPQPQSPVSQAQLPVPQPQSPAPEAQTSSGAVVKGAVAQRFLPDVPQTASETIRGTVQARIRVTVSPGGDVSNATLDSPGKSRYFDNLALEAARNWRFRPALVDGQAVSSEWILLFAFTQAATDVTPVEASP